MATTFHTDIQKLYVAYFNRPADAGGLNFWQGIVEAAGGDTSAVSAAFAASAEYQAEYDQYTNAGIVAQVYQNLFGRTPEAEGLAFWVKALNDKVMSVSDVVTQIAAGAQGTDKIAFESKVAVATAFTAALETTAEQDGYSGDLANAAAKELLSGIKTEEQASAAIVPATLHASVTAVVKAGVPFSLPTALANLVAAQDAREAFLVQADGDGDAETTALASDIATAVINAEAAIAAEIVGYTGASDGVKAVLLTEESKDRSDALVAAKAALAEKNADVGKVAGLTGAIAALESATLIATNAAKATVAANATLAGAVAAYNIAHDTATENVTVNIAANGTATISSVVGNVTTTIPAIVLTDEKLALDAGLTADQKTAVAAVFNASVAVEAAEKAESVAVAAVASLQVALDRTDYADSAADELIAVGEAMSIVQIAAGTKPTASQIVTEINALAAVRVATQTSFETARDGDVTFAADGSATFKPTGGAADPLIAVSGATLVLAAGVTEATHPGVSDLLDAAIAVKAFGAVVAAFDAADTTNPVTTSYDIANADVKAALEDVVELADLVGDLSYAQAIATELKGFDKAITEAGDVFTVDNDFSMPITVGGVIGASSGSDIYVAGETNATIVAFGTSGDDMLYIGSDFTLNTGEVAKAGDNAVLEAFLTQSGMDTIVTLETEAFGSNSSDQEVTITLVGVNVADVQLANGIITVG